MSISETVIDDIGTEGKFEHSVSTEHNDVSLYTPDPLYDAPDLTPEILVIGPGGNKGFLFLGALKYLIEEEYLNFIHTFVGCSVGSLLSLLVVIEYPIEKITELSFDMELINEISLGSLVMNGGFSNSNHIINRLKVILYEKYECMPTFKELYKVTGKELCVVAYNLSNHKVEYFNYKTTPDVKCIDAIRLSINMPIVYERVKYNNFIYIDGAMGNPYPIDLYDDGKNVILGLYLDTIQKDIIEEDITTYIHNVIVTPIKMLRSIIIKNSSSKCIHIGLIYDGPSSLTNVDEDNKIKMMKFGYDRTKLILESIYID